MNVSNIGIFHVRSPTVRCRLKIDSFELLDVFILIKIRYNVIENRIQYEYYKVSCKTFFYISETEVCIWKSLTWMISLEDEVPEKEERISKSRGH